MIFYDSAHNFSNPYKPLSYAVFEKLWLECFEKLWLEC